jgi:ATP-dependent DNA helicase RecG
VEDPELEQLLSELRAVGMERGSVEAKRAERALPSTAWQSLCAFANTDGGTLLLGVDENGGAFDVVGVRDPARMTQDLQSACAELEPPLRPRISAIKLDDDTVIVAEIPPLVRDARPCYRRAQGPYDGSFIRVGDADQALLRREVDELMAGRAGHDYSRRPAPAHASLDGAATHAFCGFIRAAGERDAALDDETILHRWNIVVDGQPTIAGLLALGEAPAAVSPAARIAYRRHPRATDPAGTRFAATHLEGTVGELLDDALVRLHRDLEKVQVKRGGHVFDDLDVPAIALREIVANALLHRSLSETQEAASITIDVTEEAVVVTSPGGLHAATDPSLLGLDTISRVRNHTLVRLCERLRTPSDARIVENQASGIASADRECRELGTMPPLFIDLPSSFRAVLFRGGLDLDSARMLLAGRGVDATPDHQRLVAVALRLQRAAEETPDPDMRRVVFDARLAARALAPRTVEDGAAALLELENAGVLERRHTRHGPFWIVRAVAAREQPPRLRAATRRDRVPDLLQAISASPEGELRSQAIGQALDLTSPNSINKWITRALERGVIEPTIDNPHAPTRAYRLTATGRAVADGRA